MGDLTLAQAKQRGAKALKEAEELVRSGKMTARNASREIIDIYWGIYYQLDMKARIEFDAWFKGEHEKAGKELGAKYAPQDRKQ